MEFSSTVGLSGGYCRAEWGWYCWAEIGAWLDGEGTVVLSVYCNVYLIGVGTMKLSRDGEYIGIYTGWKRHCMSEWLWHFRADWGWCCETGWELQAWWSLGHLDEVVQGSVYGSQESRGGTVLQSGVGFVWLTVVDTAGLS